MDNKQPIKVGLIGYGRISQFFHLRILQSLSSATLVAVAEANPQQRAAAAQKAPKATLFEDYKTLIQESDAEAVVICLPSGMHAEATLFALEHGKHVYLEKPLAISLEEAGEILALQRAKGKIGMIGFNWRFHPAYQDLKRALDSGQIGKVVSIRSMFSNPKRELQGWKKSRQSGGGTLLDLASHHIDLLRFLFDAQVEKVSGTTNSFNTEQDTAHLQIQLDNGLTAQSFFSACSVEEDSFEVFGEQGKLKANRVVADRVVFSGTSLSGVRRKQLFQNIRDIVFGPILLGRFKVDANYQAFYNALQHFTKAVQSGQPVQPDFEDGFRSLEVIINAEVSDREGRLVHIEPLQQQTMA